MAFRRAAAIVAALLIAFTAIGARPNPVAAAEPLVETGVSTYELQPDRGVVHVTIAMKLTNRKPDKTNSKTCQGFAIGPYGGVTTYSYECGSRTYYYWNTYEFWVERDAANLKVKADSGSVSLKAGTKEDFYRKVKLTFTNLYYNKSRKLTVTYDLPAGGPRSTLARRVGWVYASFCAVGPGTDSGTLNVVVPDGFQFQPTRSMKSSSAGGRRTFTTGAMTKEPWTFYACFTGSNESGYAKAPVAVSGGPTVSVEAWKEDKAWADAVTAAVRDDLPKLIGVLGPLPDSPTNLTIREGRATSPEGFDAKTGTFRLGEEVATRPEVTHRLAGLWFDTDLVGGRWLSEGYAGWAEHEAGVSDAPCTKPGPYPGTTANLASWPSMGVSPSAAQLAGLAWSRQAACNVVTTVADALGEDGMRDSIAAMRDDVDPFAIGDAAPKREHHRLLWQDWLDLVELQGLIPAGKDPAIVSDLLLEYGVTFDKDFIAAHGAARDAYLALAQALGDAPAAVVDPLRAWSFDDAKLATDAANQAIHNARAAGKTLDGVTVEGGPVLSAVAAAEDQADLDAAVKLSASQIELATDAADALDVAHAPRDVAQTVGLIGTTLPPDTALVEAVNEVDAEAEAAAANDIRSAIGGARDAGTQRIALAIGSVVGVLLLLAALVFLLRRRRRRRSRSGGRSLDPALEPTVGTTEAALPDVGSETFAESGPGDA